MVTLVRLFHRAKPLRDAISDALRELQTQKNKLQNIGVRIQQRDRLLFNLCVSSTRGRNSDKASIFANELSELRKIANIVYRNQLSLEQLILRLETVRELGDVMSQIKPAIDIMNGIRGELTGVMPEIADRLSSVNNDLGSAIAMMCPPSNLAETKVEILTSSELAEKVLNEATHIVEERIKEELPDTPPTSAVSQVKSFKEERMVLAVGGPDVEMGNIPTETDLGCKKTEEDEKMATGDGGLLKEKVFSYAKRKSGEIDVAQCAQELNIVSRDVLDALDVLCKEKRIEYQ